MKDKKYYTVNRSIKYSSRNNTKANCAKSDFPVVGIGASAGGVEALVSFLGNVPESSGLAFIIVQHMEPHREDLLVRVLQSATTMKVNQAMENISVKPNCVYVIPTDVNMSLQHRLLRISDYSAPHPQPMPIDCFFHSLAEDGQERSIGVILSGTGTDGTSGLRAIKEKGGAVFVQEPASAEFDDMPRSAIDADLADIVGPVESLPLEILSYLEHKPVVGKAYQIRANNVNCFDEIILLLRSQTGHDFSSYKKDTVRRRIARRMGIHQMDKITDYIRFLDKNSQEVELLFKELLIGVTSFFRDQWEWDLLKSRVIPALLAERSNGNMIRVWAPGCASGEEAYSVAIALKEVLEELEPAQDCFMQIFATDLNRDAIDKAREGVFPLAIEDSVSFERLQRYFVKVGRGYQVIKNIRDMVVFAQHNIIKDPPFTKIDILLCRNLLIYLTPEVQKKLIPLFHYSLNPGGFLFLGSAETIGLFTHLFKPLEHKSRIYQRQSLLQTEPLEFPTSFYPAQAAVDKPSKSVQNIQLLTDKLILQNYSPPTVLVNDKGDILYISGRTGKYLEPAAGKGNWNIFAMAREGLNFTLSNVFYQALRKKEEVVFKNAVVRNEGGTQTVDITVNPIKEPEALFGTLLIVFTDVPANAGTTTNPSDQILSGGRREAELELELMQVRQMWQAASTEMQITQEELKSSNEELQSSNEELQSTNEELTTTKEHSCNA